MDTEERLREALLDLNRARERERSALRQSNALLDALEVVTTADDPDAAIAHLLNSVKSSLSADAVVLLSASSDAQNARLEHVASTDPGVEVSGEAAVAFATSRRRRVVDLKQVGDVAVRRSNGGEQFSSLLSTPGTLDQQTTIVLMCLGHSVGQFAQSDLKLLARLTSVAAQALLAKKLNERNALLAEVIEGSSTSFAIADADDERRPLIYVNQAFEVLSGYSEDEVLGENCRFLSIEESDSDERSRLREAVQDRTPGQFELRNRRKDGEEFWNRLTLYPVSVGQDQHRYLVATQEDMTLQRQVHRERDLAESQLRSALSSTLEGVLLLGPSGEIALVNARYRDFFDTASKALKQGARFEEVHSVWLASTGIPSAEAQRHARETQAKMLEGEENREERLPDGRIVLVNSTPMPEGGCVCIVTDITRLKTTEQRLSERIVAIDEAQDGMAITDTEGRFVYLNPSHVTMFGYEEQQELLGQSWEVLYGEAERAFIQNVAMPKLMEHGKWRGDMVGVGREGGPVYQELTLTLLEDVGLICVTRDISDRIKGEAERTQLREQLNVAQRQEALGQLAAGIAHDFNNVLSVINGSAQLIALDQPGAEQSPHLKRIIAAGDQATELVARMLDIGGQEPEMVWEDFRKPFQQSVDLIRSGLPTGITISVTKPDEPIYGDLDPTQVTQIILNLAINARDAMGVHPGELTLSLSSLIPCPDDLTPAVGEVYPDQSYVRISVGDEGSGMTDETVANIFAPYFSTKGTEGTGLGLAVVASIITSIGGALNVASTPGVGTVFDVYWPVSSDETNEVSEGHHEELTGLQDVSLMVIDDDIEVAETIGTILRTHGAQVAIFADPEDALEAIVLEPERYRLAITDYDMPGMNGAELVKRTRPVAPQVKTVLCTALPTWQGRSKSAAKLFHAVIHKPIDADSLCSVVLNCLNAGDNAEGET
ncbi:MAG: PAS domain-containing protein [Pseudomonadota bacterium]